MVTLIAILWNSNLNYSLTRHPVRFFLKVGHRRKSLGARSGLYGGCCRHSQPKVAIRFCIVIAECGLALSSNNRPLDMRNPGHFSRIHLLNQGGGWRKRGADEDETGVTSRGQEEKSAGREGLTAPKRVRGAPKTQWEAECFFCRRNEKERVSARRNLQTPQQVERSWSQL
ncbi:hypothetical protein TNCV_4479941 [Trichonephila clavipes]|nr:hypothetical protein TNCV_4479941 [Trichonephila clavipes]